MAALNVGHEVQDLIWYTGTAVGEMGAPPKGWHATLRSDTRTPVWAYVRCGCVPHFATASAVVLFRGGCFRYESGLGNSYVVCDHVAVSSGTKTKVKCDDCPIGSPGGLPSRLPHRRTCGSAYGGSWQSLRIEQHSFSATVIAARQLSQSASSLRDKTTDGRVCLPSSALPGL